MATQLQIRRGTTIENNAFTGAVGELTMDTDTNGVRIHDGVTVGGVIIPTAQTADYVVEWQIPTDLNNYTWYRKYKSGWVEQGGQSDNTAQNVVYTVTLPVPMANANYTATVTSTITGNGYIPRAANRTATTFEIRCDVFSSGSNPTGVRLWTVSGMAA